MESTNQEKATTAIDTTTAVPTTTATQPMSSWSTMNLLSVDLGDLVSILDDGTHSSEDATYLSQAFEEAKLCKDHLRNDEFQLAMTHAVKAFKKADALYHLRKETQPDYQIMLAPFYYLMGHVVCCYIETSTDVFGNLQPLDFDNESEASEDENENDNHNEESKSQETLKPTTEVDEPRIEDEQINTSSNNNKNQEEEKVGKDEDGKGENAADEMCSDAWEDLSLAIQIVEDFVSSERALEAGKALRKEKCIYLLIDSYNRRAEILQFKESYEDAIADFEKVIEFTRAFPSGNERVLGSAYYLIGYINMQQKKNREAKLAYEEAIKVIRDLIIQTYKKVGKEFNSNSEAVTMKELLEPSIFDTDYIKELKSVLQDMKDKADEAVDSEEEQKKLDELKKSEGE